MPSAAQPLVSLRALERAFSPERLQGYRLPTDLDETDGAARYVWNMALVSALNPALHILEVAFRNEISRAAGKLLKGQRYTWDLVPSWLDARPTMLLANEAGKVGRAKEQLIDPGARTESHLVAKLDFGFWVALCRDAYSDWRADGPKLWPRMLGLAFTNRPSHVQTRSAILHRFDAIRQYRNRVAHHEPVWDRDYLANHEYILESLRWMSPQLAEAVRALSPAIPTFQGGPEAFRPLAERLLGTAPVHPASEP